MVQERQVSESGCTVTLDTSEQVIKVDVRPKSVGFSSPDGVHDAQVHGRLKGAQTDGFVSAAALLMKAKQFDDGLYAAIEMVAQNGTESFMGKARLLQRLLTSLPVTKTPEENVAAALLFGASWLGGNREPAPPPKLNEAISQILGEFNASPWKSKPLGFYTWNKDLAQIFQQDRLLQRPLPAKGTRAIIDALRADANLKRAYIEIQDLTAKLTNPFPGTSLAPYVVSAESPYPTDDTAFSPPSISPEGELAKKLFGNEPIPEGFSLIEELIKRIQNGAMNLQPTPNSGWYDYSIWAIEPLVLSEVLPESHKRRFSTDYKACLLDLFRGAYCLTRESHVKQLAVATVGCAPHTPPPQIYVSPEFSVEPLPSVYYRRAFGYGYLHDVLLSTFGEQALKSVWRMREGDRPEMCLLDELLDMQRLFYGAYVISCEELGMDPFVSGHSDRLNAECSARFTQWAAGMDDDPDLCRDARCMVPVFFDRERQQMKVWVFLGWRDVELDVGYATTPQVVHMDTSGFTLPSEYARSTLPPGFQPGVIFSERRVKTAYPAMAEIYVNAPLNREELQRVCDQAQTEKAILRQLEAVH